MKNNVYVYVAYVCMYVCMFIYAHISRWIPAIFYQSGIKYYYKYYLYRSMGVTKVFIALHGTAVSGKMQSSTGVPNTYILADKWTIS